MTAWDTHDDLVDFRDSADKRIKEVLSELRKELIIAAPSFDASAAVCDLFDDLDGSASDEWGDLMGKLIKEAMPSEGDPEAYENPRREHGTYDASSVWGTV